jgi:hypothetical protein
MKRNTFKGEIDKIEIPANLHQRGEMGILQAHCELKENNRTKVKRFIKPLIGVASVAIVMFFVLNVSNPSFASTIKSYFQDLFDWRGAVVGLEYNQATEEIAVKVNQPTVKSENVIVPIIITVKDAKKPPYTVIQALTLNDFEVVASSRKILKNQQISIKAESTEEIDKDVLQDIQGNEKLLSEIKSNIPTERLFQAKLIIPLSLFGNNENVSLKIHSFKGHAKAEQPIEIKGNWESDFSLND